MKVKTQDIMLRGNPQHEHFGIFAKFITGMGEEIELPDFPIHLCDKCYRALWEPSGEKTKVSMCLFCKGKEEGIKETLEKTPEKIIKKIKELPTQEIINEISELFNKKFPPKDKQRYKATDLYSKVVNYLEIKLKS